MDDVYLLIFSGILILVGTGYLLKLLWHFKKEKSALEGSEQFNRQLIEAMPGGVLQIDRDGVIGRYNDQAANQLGLGSHVIGHRLEANWYRKLVKEDGLPSPADEHPLILCLKTGAAQGPVTLGIPQPDGQVTWGIFRALPLFDRGGKHLNGVVLTLLDFTQRKRMEALTEACSRVLELIAEGKELNDVLTALALTVERQIPHSIAEVLLLNLAGTRLFIATAPRLPAEIRRFEDGALIGPMAGSNGSAAYTRRRVVDEDISTSSRWQDTSPRALQHGLRACWSEPILAANGELLGTLAIYFPSVRIPCEEEFQLLAAATHVAGIAIERHRTEEALRRSEANLARTAAFALVIPTQIGLDGSWRTIPPTLCELVGYPEPELRRLRLFDLVHPDDRNEVNSLTERLLSGELRTLDTETRLLRKDGFLVWIYLNASLVSDDQGRPMCFLTYLRDVSKRKRSELALRENEQRLKLTLRAAQMGSWDWDIKRNRIVWSEETDAMFGLHARAFAGTFEAYLALVYPEDRSFVLASVDRALKDFAEHRVEHRIFDQEGAVRWVELTGKTVVDQQGNPTRMLGTAMDVTERKQAALELEQARLRLRSLSHELLHVQETERRHIAQELHDEVGLALAVIKTNLQAVSWSLDSGPELAKLRESLIQADRGLQRVRDLTLTLRPPQLDDLGLEAALRWYVDQQTQSEPLDARFVVEDLDARLDSSIETACFRVAQEAVNNVVRHAHATRLTVELRRAAGQLHLVVRDNGDGFDVSAQRRRAGSRVRVGLLSIEERAAAIGGRIEIHSQPGQGTEVDAWFPLVASQAQDLSVSPLNR